MAGGHARPLEQRVTLYLQVGLMLLGRRRTLTTLLRVGLPLPCMVSVLVLSAVQVSGGVQSLGGEPDLVLCVPPSVEGPRVSVGEGPALLPQGVGCFLLLHHWPS